MEDLRQVKEYATYMERIGWKVDEVSGVYCYSRKIVYPSVLKIQRPTRLLVVNDIQKIVKLRKSVYVLIEPSNSKQVNFYLKNGYREAKSPSLPSKTIRIDLRASEEKLLAHMHHKTRYNTGLAKRRKVMVERSKDITLFVDLWQKAAKKRGMFISQKKEIKAIYDAFKKTSEIFFALKNSELLSGVLLLRTKDVAYYMYAFSNDKGKKLFAPTLIAWETMKYAKEKHCKCYDFEGIYDERLPLKDWKGFTRFKKGFGGEEIEFPLPLRKYYLL